MKIPEEYLDKFEMVLPSKRHEDKPCDNGVLFTSIAKMLGFDVGNYQEKIRACYIKKGLVGRWKGNNYDFVAWDDYLGIASACISIGERWIPREILVYAFPVFYFNPTKRLSFKAWLGRHPQVWLLMWCAAFPILKYPMYPLLKLVTLFFNSPAELLEKNNSSGLQLQWVFLKSCEALGFNLDKHNQHHTYQAKMFQQYYGEGHPFRGV